MEYENDDGLIGKAHRLHKESLHPDKIRLEHKKIYSDD